MDGFYMFTAPDASKYTNFYHCLPLYCMSSQYNKSWQGMREEIVAALMGSFSSLTRLSMHGLLYWPNISRQNTWLQMLV